MIQSTLIRIASSLKTCFSIGTTNPCTALFRERVFQNQLPPIHARNPHLVLELPLIDENAPLHQPEPVKNDQKSDTSENEEPETETVSSNEIQIKPRFDRYTQTDDTESNLDESETRKLQIQVLDLQTQTNLIETKNMMLEFKILDLQKEIKHLLNENASKELEIRKLKSIQAYVSEKITNSIEIIDSSKNNSPSHQTRIHSSTINNSSQRDPKSKPSVDTKPNWVPSTTGNNGKPFAPPPNPFRS